jgi:hypothetical protein
MIIVVAFPQVSSQSPQSARPVVNIGFVPNRSVTLTIRIVFLGLQPSDLNSTYLTSNVSVSGLKYQAILAGPLDTGVIFNFKYQFVYANSSVVTKFANYLQSIGIAQNTTGGVSNSPALKNPYFSNSSTLSSAVNYFYDADKVQSWLSSNMGLFGTIPVPGYTLFIADLHNYGIPSLTYREYQNYAQTCTTSCRPSAVHAHYYNRTLSDVDLGLRLTRHYMTGWGGSGRFYYLDLSAGPSYWTNELPVQVAASLRGITAASYYGKLWTSKFVDSYVFGAVNNLFAADQLYPVNYSQKYNFQLFVFDNRTNSVRMSGPKLTTTLNRAFVQSQLANLLPFANVTVNVRFANVTDYPRLAAMIANATTTVRDPVSGRPIVDGELVYNWLTTSGLGHITQFINVTRTFSEIDIPAFIFAFNGSYTFGFPIKENIASTASRATFSGEALGDMVLIGLGESDLTIGNNSTLYGQLGKGVGFTHAAVHELGHMVGLNHPFIYDSTEDFTDTVMGYYSYSSTYSQFDKDTILRGVNDELLTFAQQTLASTSNTLFNSASISNAERNMARANQLYDSMNYSGAVPYSLAAALDAASAQQLANNAFLSPGLVFGLTGVAIGVGVGLLIGFLAFRRRTSVGVQYNRCPTCQQPTRWDPVQMHWYCDRCQKPI